MITKNERKNAKLDQNDEKKEIEDVVPKTSNKTVVYDNYTPVEY